MRYILNPSTDPGFNLAAEEWLLSESDSEVFMLWRNASAVIVGRNQNTLSQIDEAFVRKRNIPVIRRLTGGGAVFHDLGNVNFTFIALNRGTEGLDFLRFTTPVMEALRAMGVDCAFDGRNDLVIGGRKFSGNAQHIAGNRVLHHGTLLFASEIADISGALRVDPAKYRDKAVKSVAKRVTNIASHLPEPMDVRTFMDRLMDNVSGNVAGTVADNGQGRTVLAEEEMRAIEELAGRKYRTWEWNYGSSPDYGFTRSTRTPGGVVEVHMDVEAGTIRRIRLFGDYFGVRDVAGLEALLTGCRHDRQALAERLDGHLAEVPLDDYLRGVPLSAFLDCLF
ncbi:lipoyltransferase and lipoate-protein ligase [Desulfovibrio sp. X2]|uniref:lipoate--protein ligase n=1 Tax=Desulfovibrio sp. X2 TaxID=941449 RepID=UPI000358937D|nr:lipoate--protein ligase [Desulfovibrio sp. X2]EPR37134.1 lipoyltransferase and lipoate-protein ligase [Desulfovibrio sp. X2]